MRHTIFFSWQSDTSTKSGRNLVERALDRAVGAIGLDTEVEEAVREGLEVDRDTKGVSGSPPIVETIFKKIDAAAVFVADLTFAGRRPDGAPIPNPNVLIEYGWALKSLGHSRIVAIMNTAYGNPTDEEMPFDMRHLRHPIQYDCPESADEDTRSKVRNALAKQLEGAIRSVIDSDAFQATLPKPPPPVPFQAKNVQDGPARYRARGERLGITSDILMGGRDVFLQDGPAMWLRLMPAFDPGMRWTALDFQSAIQSHLPPLGSFELGGYSSFRADDGCGTFSSLGNGEPTPASAILFDTGEIWTINTICMQGHHYVPFRREYISTALIGYLSMFQEYLRFDGELDWEVGFDGVLDRFLGFENLDVPRVLGTKAQCLTSTIVFRDRYNKSASVSENIESCYSFVRTKCGFRL